MTRKLATIVASALGNPTLAGKLLHNYMVLSGDKATDVASAIVETIPGFDEDQAYEIAFHAIYG